MPWSAIARAIADAAPADLQAFDLKDRYQGEGVPAGAVNTTISFRYNAPDRSLQQEEVNARQAEIAQAARPALRLAGQGDSMSADLDWARLEAVVARAVERLRAGRGGEPDPARRSGATRGGARERARRGSAGPRGNDGRTEEVRRRLTQLEGEIESLLG